MEALQKSVRNKIESQIQHMLDNTVVTDRRFLDDEQLLIFEWRNERT